VDPGAACHSERFGIDRGDRLLKETHARLRDLPVREANCGERTPKRDVELRVLEDERVVLVDQT